MAVESLPGFLEQSYLSAKPVYTEVSSTEVVEPVMESKINYAERAATVEYHSRLYLLPLNLTEQYRNYLTLKGLSSRQIEEKLEYVRLFFKDREKMMLDGNDTQSSMIGEEEELLMSMYDQSVATVRRETIDNPDNYDLPEGRVYAGDIFIQNFLQYSNDQRIQILQDLGYKKEDARKIAVGLGTAVASTIALQILEGPTADIISTYLARVDGMQELSHQISQLEPVVKWLATAGIVLGSAASHYITTYAKTLQTLRAIREGSYAVPNAVVAADAIVSHRLLDEKENNFKLHWKLFKKHMASPWVLWDEKWNLTLLAMDFGVTYTTGNLISSSLNAAQILFMEANIQYHRLQKKLGQKQMRGELNVSEETELENAQALVMQQGQRLEQEYAFLGDD